MAEIIARILAWLAGKLVVYAFLFALLLGIFILKVVPPLVVKHHERELEKAIAQLSQSKALVGELKARADQVSADFEQRAAELRELDAKRRELEGWLIRLKNFFQREKAEAEKNRLLAEEKRLREEMSALTAEKRRIHLEGGETEEEIKRREVLRDEKQTQLRNIREKERFYNELMRSELRDLALKALFLLIALMAIPFLWKWAAFYLIAPLASSMRPILLQKAPYSGAPVTATASHPAQRLNLEPDDTLLAKVDYIQGSMGSFEKRTKWLMDWHYPFSSMAAGLYMLTSIRRESGDGGEVTLSAREDATEEVAVIDIPEGQAMVFRPHYLVGIAFPDGHPPRIVSRWIFNRIHAWVNFRFRYLMMEGPVKMVLSAPRGVQVEKVESAAEGRRVNSNLTAAFSPQLDYLPKKAETFVAYLRGKNALFDDYFSGDGVVIQQQVTAGKGRPAARIWEGVFGAVGKALGL